MKYRDRVTIKNGFFQGLTGEVVDQKTRSRFNETPIYEYQVRIDTELITAWVDEENLEKL